MIDRPLFAAGPDGLVYRYGYVQHFVRPHRAEAELIAAVRHLFAVVHGLQVTEIRTAWQGDVLAITVIHERVQHARARGTRAGRCVQAVRARQLAA